MTATERKRSRIEGIVRACRLIMRLNRIRPDASRSEDLYYQMLTTYFTNLMNAENGKGFIASHSVFFPVEVLYAMGITPLHGELSTWMSAMYLGDQAEILAKGAELGLAPEICSPHRGLAGAFATNALVRPDAVLWSNLICDNTAKCGELLMELNHAPGFFLEHPFQQSELEEQYMVEELKDMIRFLEEKSGRKMDWDRLSGTVARMDKQLQLYREICELRKSVPSPFPSRRFLELLSVDYMFAGQPEETEYLEVLRNELADMVRQGKGAVTPERFRLMILFIPPLYLIGAIEKILQEHGAVSVVDPLFTRWGEGRLDPSRPLESIVRKSYMTPEMCSMYGPLTDRAIQDVVKCAQEYKVDGVIYYAFMGCRHTCATIKLFKDVLNEIDVPVLTLDCDLVDPTITSESEIKEKLERFFELLEDR